MHVLMTQSDKGIDEKYILDQGVKFNGIWFYHLLIVRFRW